MAPDGAAKTLPVARVTASKNAGAPKLCLILEDIQLSPLPRMAAAVASFVSMRYVGKGASAKKTMRSSSLKLTVTRIPNPHRKTPEPTSSA
jgi:hypothetical protein